MSKADRFGKVWKVTEDYGGDGKKLGLSKTNLGLFMYSLLKCDGEIGSVYCMNHNYDRSYVQASVKIHPDKIEEFENMCGIKLYNPPVINVN